MASLSSPSGCSSCLWLSQKIAELEGRISVLYQIKDDEDLLDSMLATSQVISAGLDGSLPRAAAPAAQEEEHWPRLGAKPKAAKVCSSTPRQAEPWSIVGGGWRGGRRSALPEYRRNIGVSNKFSMLEDLDEATPTESIRVSSPDLCFTQAPPENPTVQRAWHATTQLTAAGQPSPAGQAPSHTQNGQHGRRSPPRESARRPRGSPLITEPRPHRLPQTQTRRPQPTTLVIGHSIVRNIHHHTATVHSVSGAKVSDITLQLPSLLKEHQSVERIIIHVGCNDIRNQSTELLKKDFTRLLSSIQDCGKSVFISGPIPSLGRGSGHFSRLLNLHTWLQNTCLSQDLHFLDNFNLFWNRPSFYRFDGIHPNRLGAQILGHNMFYSVFNST
ncbi:hypothetical protein AMEX_G26567 [Astyanax mexicanus]|uniref:SGNH hydrolase-type esterase domain-containing protein n=1 Tax=Astyanax mexicanus TaxID=7994 RepID=A0A8T2KRF4_ASTMX|nr:hypothetical protein AMEX_G26567 [Astyanax mexicanus]